MFAKTKKLMALVLVFCLFSGMLSAVGNAAFEEVDSSSEANSQEETVEEKIERIKDSVYGGAWATSHCQGVAIDDALEYIYFSFTTKLVKCSLETGAIVATVAGWSGHLGDMCYYDGRVYGSLEYKNPNNAFYIAAFDCDKITEMDMDASECMTSMYLDVVHDDYVNTVVEGGSIAESTSANGHAYGCSGIDGVAFGKVPGSDSDEMKLMVMYGVFRGDGRSDNDYQVMLQYDLESFLEDDGNGWTKFKDGVSDVLNQTHFHTTGPIHETRYFIYTGNTNYGVQNLCYDKESGNYLLAVYKGSKSSFPNYGLYYVDGLVAPHYETLKLGDRQGNYADMSYAGVTREGQSIADGGKIPMNEGWVLDLAKIGVLHEASGVYGTAAVGGMDTGIEHIAGDYFYIVPSSGSGGLQTATATMFMLDRSDHSWSRKLSGGKAEAILRYSMDAADIYTDDQGNTRMKDSEGSGYDACISGTIATADIGGAANSALAFNAYNYPAQMDRLYLDADAIGYVNNKITSSYSCSFWSRMAFGANTDGNFDPFIGFYRSDGTYAGVFESRWRNKMKFVVNGIGSAGAGSPGDDGSYFRNLNTNEDLIFSDEGWHLYTVTESDGYGALYMDGKPAGTYTVAANHLLTDPITHFEVGGGLAKLWYDRNNRGRLIGAVDDITIYSGALTADEVAALYDSGPTGAAAASADGAAEFDLAKPEDQNIIIGLRSSVNVLEGIEGLSEGADFTIAPNGADESSRVLTLKKEYLSTLAQGEHKLRAKFYSSEDLEITVSVSDSTNEFEPLYPSFDLYEDKSADLTVVAAKAVSGVAGLTAGDVTISGGSIVFSNVFLSKKSCGIYPLTVSFADGTSSVLKLTITNTDPDNPLAVLHYTMSKNDIDGSVVRDSSAYGVNAYTSTNATAASHNGVKNSALVFNGYDYIDVDYVTLGKAETQWLNSMIKKGYTINFWANASAENGGVMSMLGLYAEDGRPLGVVEEFDDSGIDDRVSDGKIPLQLDIAENSSSHFAAKADESVMSTAGWYMISATYDAASKESAIYVNGVLREKVTDVNAEVIGKIEAFRIGTQYKKYYSSGGDRDWSTRGGFKGGIDEVSLYNTALSEEQVSALYGKGPTTPAESTKPIVHYTMDADTLNGDGSVTDSSAYGNDGFYQNLSVVPGADGLSGGALHFDGDAAQLSRLWMGQKGIDFLNESVDKQITLSFWFKSDSADVNETYSGYWTPIAGIYTSKTSNGAPGRYMLVAEFRSPNLVMEVNNYPSTAWPTDIRTISDTNVSDGNWHYIVMTIDGEKTETVGVAQSQYRRLYIDGRACSNDRAAYLDSDLLGFIESFEIGGEPYKCWSDTNVRGRVSGAVDDVKIHDVPFTDADVAREYKKGVTTVSDALYLETTKYSVDLANPEDVEIEVRNAQNLTSISGLDASQHSFDGTTVTIKASVFDAAGEYNYSLNFLNGSKIVRVSAVDNRVYFEPACVVYDKSNSADVSFKALFTDAVVKLSGEEITESDYTIQGNDITISKDYLYGKQPGVLCLTVTDAQGNAAIAKIHVSHTAPTLYDAFPILYYNMDSTEGGLLSDQSGNGIDAVIENAAAAANKDAQENSALFFDGYQDTELVRAYLEDDGIEYLNTSIENAATISYWFSSDRISSNFMPVMGLFGEGGRPAMMSQFRSSGNERQGAGQSTYPSIVNTPAGVTTPNANFVKSDTQLAMNKVWHHMLTVYDGDSGMAYIYIDGVLLGSGTAASGALDDITDFAIGGMLNQYYSYEMSTKEEIGKARALNGRFYGTLDEVKLYNVALGAEDARALYAQGVGENSALPEDNTALITKLARLIDQVNSAGSGDVDENHKDRWKTVVDEAQAALGKGVNASKQELLESIEKLEQIEYYTHDWSGDWKHDRSKHWHECDCGEISKKEDHVIESGACSICGYTYPPPYVEVTPDPDPEKCLCERFDDIDKNVWYHTYVEYVLSERLFNGVSEASFAPNGLMNRAMLVTVLYRMEGAPAVSGNSTYTDVPDGLWYANAIIWATESGIVDGYGEGLFNPMGKVTREQAVVMLYRWAAYKGVDLSSMDELGGFKDAGSVSKYATAAVRWAVAEGLLNGVGDNLLQPGGTAVRAQIAAIIQRFNENIVK